MGIDVATLGPEARKQIAAQMGGLRKDPKPSKYHNKPQTDEDGTRHASTKQQRRWHDLKLLEKADEIMWLRREVEFPLAVNGQDCGSYIADHVYMERVINRVTRHQEAWREVIEDVKSEATKTPVYLLKKKLMKAIYGIEIREV
jgi:hypothetical protein